MNEIQLFNNPDFGSVRTLEENGQILFCGNDVAKALGFGNPRAALARHCAHVTKRDGVSKTTNQYGTTTEQVQEMSFIPESDLYRLTFGSKLPNAEKFTDWVTETVLPTIRRTGGYVNNDQQFIDTYLPYADDATKAMFQSTLAVVREQNRQLAEAKPKVQFFDAVADSRGGILVRDLAKLLKQNGIPTGERRLFEWLRKNGYLCSSGTSRNTPTQKAMDMGLFIIRVSQRAQDGEILEDKTTYVTGKGQQFFLKKFLPAVEVSQSFVQKNRENHG